MIAFAVFAALVLGLPVLGLLPPLRQGRAFNAIAHIAMPARAQYGARWASVLAQEVVEWWCAWAGAFVLASLPAALLDLYTPFGLGAPLLALAGWSWRRTTTGERQLEYLGWAAEWLHGRKSAPDEYRNLPLYADRMRRGYPHLFGAMTSLQVQRKLESRFWPARLLLALLALRIRRASA